jgi:hypothetical protein
MLNRPDSATATSFAKVMIDIATGKVADREPRAPFFRISTDDVIEWRIFSPRLILSLDTFSRVILIIAVAIKVRSDRRPPP